MNLNAFENSEISSLQSQSASSKRAIFDPYTDQKQQPVKDCIPPSSG